MKTLQEMLRERVGGDGRAATAVIDVRRDEVRLLFGAIGSLGRIILSVVGDEVHVISPARKDESAEAGEADSEADAATGVRRPVDIDAGEYVDSNTPLRPGENPADAPARIEAEGLSARQPEAVSTTAIPVATVAGSGVLTDAQDREAASEIKNAQPDVSAETSVDASSHSKEELVDLAKKRGVTVNAGDTKAEIAVAINKARSANA